MRRRLSASIFALVSATSIALLAPTGCSGTNGGSGFGDPGNPNNNNGDSGNNMQGSNDSGPGTYDTGSFGPLMDSGGMLSPDSSCATASAQASRQPVYMLFILDGSGSMQQNNKWTAATQALTTIFGDFQTKADTGFGVGLIVFSDTNDGTFGGGPYPEGSDVSIGFVNSSQLGLLDGRMSGGPGGGTPTGAALTGAYGEIEPYTPAAPLLTGGKKVVVLLTDGVPTDCGTGASSSCIPLASTALGLSSPQGPVTTFVIGTGQFPSSDPTNFDPVFLGHLAQAGGAAPAGCDPNNNTSTTNLCYFEVDPTTGSAAQTAAAFEAAINAIRGQVASCTFQLNNSGGMIDPSKVNVIFTPSTGMPVELVQDGTNGWTYNNPTAPTEVILNGTSCANMKADPMGKITIVLGCATKTPK